MVFQTNGDSAFLGGGQALLEAVDPEVLATTTKLAWAYNMSGQSEKAQRPFENVLRGDECACLLLLLSH